MSAATEVVWDERLRDLVEVGSAALGPTAPGLLGPARSGTMHPAELIAAVALATADLDGDWCDLLADAATLVMELLERSGGGAWMSDGDDLRDAIERAVSGCSECGAPHLITCDSRILRVG